MISASGLTKNYGDACAIRDLSFEIDEGEIVGILGLNGAGKTTTLKILACLLLPSSGTVRIGDIDIASNPHDIKKMVGFLPESPPLYEEMAVDSFLLFAGQLRGLSTDRARSRMNEVVELTNLQEVKEKVIGTLSHGFRQRVGLAQAVIHDPALLILDEPIKGLDPVQIVEVRRMVRDLKGRHTILLSSHILTEISQTCDRLLMIKDGQLVASGTEEELTKKLAGRRMLVVVRGPRDAVREAVEELDTVASVELKSEEPEKNLRTLDVTSEGSLERAAEAVSRALVAKDFGLIQLTPFEAELESAFLQLTGDTAPPGGAGGPPSEPAEPSGAAEEAPAEEERGGEDA